jgi:HlyD family secretion protein
MARSTVWTVRAVLVVVIGAWSAYGFHKPEGVRVTTASVDEGPIVRRVVATGTVQAVATVRVAAQISGTIQLLAADYNSIVHAGQPIAKLDPALFEAALREAQAAREQAQATLAEAEAHVSSLEAAARDADAKLSRAEALAGKQLIPQSDLDGARMAKEEADADVWSAQAEVDEARAAVVQASANVEQSTINLERTVIHSPIDGIVVSRNVDVGQTVAATLEAPVLFNIAADLEHVQVEVDVDESDVGAVAQGEPATFTVESYGDELFKGVVSQVRLQPVTGRTGSDSESPGAVATTGSGTAGPAANVMAAPTGAGLPAASPDGAVSYATIIDVPNPAEKLRPGMTAIVTLPGSHRDRAVRIPNGALSFRPPADVLDAIGQTADVPTTASATADATRGEVWRFDGGRFIPIDVRLGLAGEEQTELITGTVSPGDLLVTGASLGGRATR